MANGFGPDHGSKISRNWRTALKQGQLDRARTTRARNDRLKIDSPWAGFHFGGALLNRYKNRSPPGSKETKLDWNLATGGFGSVLGSPAKYSFDISAWDCSDVIYFTVDQTGGTATRVNLIGITNAYVTCPGNPAGATPTVKFGFAMQYGAPTSAVPSLDGQVLYVIESRPSGNGGVILHAINVDRVSASGTYDFTTNTWAGARDLSTIGMGTTGEQLFEMTFGGVTNTLASPYLDYDTNQLFFGDSRGRIHRVANVHTANPTKDLTNFPVACGANALQSPVFYDGQIVTTSANGRAYRINTTVPPPAARYSCIASAQGGAGTGVGVGGGVSAPVIDVTNEQIIILSNYASGFAVRGIGMLPLRFSPGTSQTSAQALGAGSATLAPQPPSFDEAFWSSNAGNLYAPGSRSSGAAGTYLVRVPYNGAALGAPAGFATLFRSGTTAAQTVSTSPVTEFLTASTLANKDFVFVGGATGNYRYINRIGAGFSGSEAAPTAMSGAFQHPSGGGVASGIVIDTRTEGVTGSMATANVYFGTVGASPTTQSRIIQLAQQF